MIAVNTSGALAQLLHKQGNISNLTGNHQFESLQKWLEKNEATLVPTFPGIQELNMQTYFQLQCYTSLSQSDLDEFLQLPGIEAVYEKPADELPH